MMLLLVTYVVMILDPLSTLADSASILSAKSLGPLRVQSAPLSNSPDDQNNRKRDSAKTVLFTFSE